MDENKIFAVSLRRRGKEEMTEMKKTGVEKAEDCKEEEVTRKRNRKIPSPAISCLIDRGTRGDWS